MNKTEFLRTVSRNMKKYRDTHGLTQEQFAEKAGISLSFCAAVETGRKVPSAFTLRKMADRLDVTVDYFLYQDSVSKEIKTISTQLSDKRPEYIDFVSRLISLCNEYDKTKE